MFGVIAVVVALALGAVFLHSFPMGYHARMVFYALQGFRRGRFSRLDEPVSQEQRVLIDDLDINIHMNNARYNQYADYGRYTWCCRVLGKFSLFKTYRIANGGVAMSFLAEFKPFDRFLVQTRLVGFDAKWFFISHEFTAPNGKVHALGICKMVFKNGRKTIPPQEAFEALGYKVEADRFNAEAGAKWMSSAEALQAHLVALAGLRDPSAKAS